MASSVSSEVFWAALERSGLLTEQQLAVMQDSLLSHELPAAELSRQFVQAGWLTPFQADRLLQGRSRGFFFDQYKVVDLLGLGGMGWVYRAVDTVTQENVALKVLRDDLKLDPGMLARFQQEARVGLRLEHPNIVRTKSVGSAGGLPYVIMEFVPGPNLLELLTLNRRLPWPQACEFARQAALGLEYAHGRGVVHRDVKPQNLLINQAGEVRLLDFGLSMFQEGESGDEFSLAMIFGHESVGTSEFAAPEQVKDSLAADARSDVFSLGATLFAALTGLNPFPTGNKKPDYQVCSRSVREFVPSIPAEVAEIVTRMLEADPQRRFRTAGEVATALADWSKSGPVEFDFPAIMKERKQYARQRLAQISESAASALGFARSTARPGAASSVAKSHVSRPSNLSTGESSLSPQLSAGKGPLPDSIRGPAVRWAAETKPQSSLGATLIVVDGEGRIPLLQDRVLVGRGEECDLRLTDPAVSSRHGEFQFDGRRWWIADLSSRNGTTVNGAAVKRQALQQGDEIVIASLQRFRWDCDRSPVKTGSPLWQVLRSPFLWIAILLTALLAAFAWWR